SAPINNLYDFIEEKKRIAELKRLLYVGITRAKDHLIISGEIEQNGRLKKDSFLGLIDSGIKIDFASENILLNGSLDFLRYTGADYKTETKQISFKIPVIKSAEFKTDFITQSETKQHKKIINTDKLKHPEEKEIISATK